MRRSVGIQCMIVWLWLFSVINDTGGCRNRSEDISLDNNSKAGDRSVDSHYTVFNSCVLTFIQEVQLSLG